VKGKRPILSQMGKVMGAFFKVIEVMVYHFFILKRMSW